MAFTFFFRDTQILKLAVEHVVPFAMGRSRVRIWDAGCAMGPEPYSLAILLAESMGYFAFKNLRIYATDIDETDTFGQTIRTGTYPEEDLKRIQPDIFKKYFVPNDKPGYFRVVDTIREHVIFEKHDLLSLRPIGEDFSLILCKNVLLHFQPNERIDVIKLFHGSLSQGGYLATEQTQKMPEQVEYLFGRVAANGQIFKKEAAQA
ncbi:MAG TPA: CheR family methyltransferase [Syntrophorhabdaceae bacterium]|nr:CheR family methyltransferase [Syntrophorhabdaceae bacterium]